MAVGCLVTTLLLITVTMVMGDIDNLALNRPTAQSSISQYGGCTRRSCGASQANDGKIGTNSVTRSNENSEWWSVDLGDLVKISRILIYLSQDSFVWKKPYYSRVVVSTSKQNPGKWSVCKGLGKRTKSREKYLVCNRPTVARYVLVSIRGKKPLYLAEVKVYGTYVNEISNLALNRPSAQSSIDCKSGSCGASQANDGKTETISKTLGDKRVEWWSVALGNVAKINRILLYPSQDLDAWKKGYYSNLVVLARKQSTDKWSVCKYLRKLKREGVFVIVCNRPTVARYVAVATLNKKPLYLAEVKVYGTYVKDLSN